MLRSIFFLILLYIAVLLEARLTTLPLAIDVLLFGFLFLDRRVLLLLAFGSGVFLDFLSLGAMGIRSLSLLLLVLVLLIYESKFETYTVSFVAVFSFVGGFCYLLFLGYTEILLQAVANTAICSVVFVIARNAMTKQSRLGDRHTSLHSVHDDTFL